MTIAAATGHMKRNSKPVLTHSLADNNPVKLTKSSDVSIYTPSAGLRAIVKRFLVVEFSTVHQDSHLPDSGLVVVFRYKGDCGLENGINSPSCAITGIYDARRGHMHGQNSAAVIVALTAMGASALVRNPLHEFCNSTTDLETIMSRMTEVHNICEKLEKAKTNLKRIEIVEQFLLAQTFAHCADPLVATLTGWIEQAHGIVNVRELSRKVGLSQSALERRYLRVIGTSPKRFASIIRLQNVLRLQAKGRDFTTIAHEAGYCDQPHFIKNFKRISGVAPNVFFKR